MVRGVSGSTGERDKREKSHTRHYYVRNVLLMRYVDILMRLEKLGFQLRGYKGIAIFRQVSQ